MLLVPLYFVVFIMRCVGSQSLKISFFLIFPSNFAAAIPCFPNRTFASYCLWCSPPPFSFSLPFPFCLGKETDRPTKLCSLPSSSHPILLSILCLATLWCPSGVPLVSIQQASPFRNCSGQSTHLRNLPGY